jgi:hypothetical protein
MNFKPILVLFSTVCYLSGCSQKLPCFTEKTLDSNIVTNCWTKTIGDLNADGIDDLIIGGYDSGGIWAYFSPGLEKRQITDKKGASTDAEIADIDNDRDNDLVAIFSNEIIWFENPSWEIHTIIDSLETHDIVVADFDGDQLIDIAARNQGEFGSSGETLFLLRQLKSDNWDYFEIPVKNGEGLTGCDLNNDKRMDLIINGSWFENTGNIKDWREHVFTEQWTWKNAFIDVADFNNDGRTDIVMSPSELSGNYYRISWFEAPANITGIWKENVVIPDIETVVHYVGTADFNNDGNTDIAYAEMTQGVDPDEVVILFNMGTNKWVKRVISNEGSHSMRITDIDNDGDPDLFGANWNDNKVKIWLNELK